MRDRTEEEALSRCKQRLLMALQDYKQRHRGEYPERLRVSSTDFLLLKSHELIDARGCYRGLGLRVTTL